MKTMIVHRPYVNLLLHNQIIIYTPRIKNKKQHKDALNKMSNSSGRVGKIFSRLEFLYGVCSRKNDLIERDFIK